MGHISTTEKSNNVNKNIDFHIMAIDIGVTRRPPTQKCAKGQELYPGLVEFILNSSDYSSNILYEISDGKLGYSASDEAEIVSQCSSISYSLPYTDMMTTVHKFRGGFCDALMDLQSFHLLLLTLHQKLEGLFWILESIVSRNSEEHEKNESQNSISPRSRNFGVSTSLCKERLTIESHADSIDSESHKNTPRSSPREESE
ncbi:Dual specificity protein phosphatase PHS1 [Platanthera guangdongensis]|uniref:Dual specificity protein phosphatase PHS1 n=1 Tax=Platanthera guangdongensis TaxID=2320717 RepID=A0ABR2LX00_9ASPA